MREFVSIVPDHDVAFPRGCVSALLGVAPSPSTPSTGSVAGGGSGDLDVELWVHGSGLHKGWGAPGVVARPPPPPGQHRPPRPLGVERLVIRHTGLVTGAIFLWFHFLIVILKSQ